MAKTPYIDLSTQDILSAHISGLAHSINKIEDVLDMKTSQATFTLNPVADQDEVALRYRIYEGQHRNWTNFTLRRNGQTVSSEEYIAQPEFGVIVFHTPQTQTDVVEVTATYITGESNKVDEIESDISSLQSELSDVRSSISNLESDVSSLETEVQNLKNNSGGGSDGSSGGDYPPGGIYIPLRQPTKSLFTNIRPDKTTSDLTGTSANILMLSNTIDAIPIIIDHRTKISRLQMVGGIGTSSGSIILGIYGDSALAPGDLIAQTELFSMGSGNIIKNLIESVYLDPGLYWIARWQTGSSIRLDGHPYQSDTHIVFEPVSASLTNNNGTAPSDHIIGVRTAANLSGLTSLPEEFPPIGANSGDSKYLVRKDIGTMYALR